MTGAATAAGLLLAVLGFALAFLPRRVAVAGAILAALAALAARIAVPTPRADIALTGCWITLVLAALSVYWPRLARANPWLALGFTAWAGVWAGLAVGADPGSTGGVGDLWAELAAILAGVPAAVFIARGWGLAVRVVTSWLLAVAMLVGMIPHLVVHPGYVPDHRI